MLPAVPFWLYKLIAIIIKAGGWPLVILISTLIGKGFLKSVDDVMDYLKKNGHI